MTCPESYTYVTGDSGSEHEDLHVNRKDTTEYSSSVCLPGSKGLSVHLKGRAKSRPAAENLDVAPQVILACWRRGNGSRNLARGRSLPMSTWRLGKCLVLCSKKPRVCADRGSRTETLNVRRDGP